MTGIGTKPGDVVAMFALPMPLTAMPSISEVIARVYGSGEASLSFDGDAVRIYAPREGFGPRPKGRIKAARPLDDDALGTFDLDDDRLVVTIEDSTAVVSAIASHLAGFFEHFAGINYVESRFTTTGQSEEDMEYAVVVQKVSGRTAHDLRQEAEARVAELEQENERLRQRVESLEGETA
ncbi:hypothetical protein GCM10025867_47980 (plasmid) [Frondihabitans sucicola]|uniref:Uncharacterized protein n=1 Tax=Frondihabitans sucicola TaxID=1268041 RepID=A0ABM8GVQ7_9MICO|nr:hypothetical protein [Frondihabitans sucicola]BDZ52557.1 hypothetical protein GCM10025867_47980 [Frondihabitans sucicola]